MSRQSAATPRANSRRQSIFLETFGNSVAAGSPLVGNKNFVERKRALNDPTNHRAAGDTATDASNARFVRQFTRCESSVRAYVRSLAWPGLDIDDLMQNTGLACWRKFATFDANGTPDDFVRWACVVARFEVLRARRCVARDRFVLDESVIEQLADDAEQRLRQAERERLAISGCLDQLDDAAKRLLLAVHTPGDAVARVSKETGVAARKLYNNLDLLRARLRRCVENRLTTEAPS